MMTPKNISSSETLRIRRKIWKKFYFWRVSKKLRSIYNSSIRWSEIGRGFLSGNPWANYPATKRILELEKYNKNQCLRSTRVRRQRLHTVFCGLKKKPWMRWMTPSFWRAVFGFKIRLWNSISVEIFSVSLITVHTHGIFSSLYCMQPLPSAPRRKGKGHEGCTYCFTEEGKNIRKCRSGGTG